MSSLLRTVQECSRLGQHAMLKPYATLPYLSSLLSEVRTLEHLGYVVPNARYVRGKAVADQPSLTKVSKAWLQSLKNITTVTLFESDFISATLFCLPPGAELPIHDHPTMHVLNSVIDGGLVAKGYEWRLDDDGIDFRLDYSHIGELIKVRNAEAQLYEKALAAMKASEAAVGGGAAASPSFATTGGGAGVERTLASMRDTMHLLKAMPNTGRHVKLDKTVPNATLVQHGVVTPSCGVQWIRPFGGGSLHSFRAPTASSPVAFIDIITPPYYRGASLSIPCTYMEALIDGQHVGDKCALRQMVSPPPLHMDGYTAAHLLP